MDVQGGNLTWAPRARAPMPIMEPPPLIAHGDFATIAHLLTKDAGLDTARGVQPTTVAIAYLDHALFPPS